jgi:hypothetical protein
MHVTYQREDRVYFFYNNTFQDNVIFKYFLQMISNASRAEAY